MKPYKFQRKDIAKILAEPSRGVLNASITGAMKTLVAVEVLHQAEPAPKQVLIIAPKNTLDGWTRTCLENAGIELREMSGVSGSNAAYHAAREFMAGVPGWFFVSWEFSIRMEYRKFKMDALILDELHRLSGRGSRKAHLGWVLGKIVEKKGGYRIGLSATPYGNQMQGAWCVHRAIWPSSTPLSFWKWVGTHLVHTQEVIKDRNGDPLAIDKVGDELVRGSVIGSVPLYIRHEERQRCCKHHPEGIQADLPPRQIHRVSVELTDTQRRLYDQMEKDYFAWIEESKWPLSTEGYPMVQSIRLHQICLAVPTTDLARRLKTDPLTGTRYGEEYIKVSYPLNARSSKIDAVLDILADIPTDEPVLIFTHSRGIIDAVVHRINATTSPVATGNWLRAVAWHGGVNATERTYIKQRFTERKVQVIVAQVGAIAEGVDGLQEVCCNEIWMSLSNDDLQNIQALGRLMRKGQQHVINSWQIYAADTVELAQYERLMVRGARMRSALKSSKPEKKLKKKSRQTARSRTMSE